jgi:hypothetical protein
MRADSKRHGGDILVLIAVLALAVGACGSSTASTNPGATNGQTGGPADTSVPTAGGDQGTAISGAAANLAGVRSYKFTMTLAGGPFSSLPSMFGDSGSDSAPFTISGTMVVSPESAADVKLASVHMIEVGGYDYMEQDDGSYVQTQVTGSGLISSFDPAVLYADAIDASADNGYSLVGTETKNAVGADHYQASAAYLAQYGSILGVANATWSADVWLARDGGYPVSIAILAKAADGTVVYEMSFDLTNIDDPANTVTAPTNIAGA